MNSHPDCYGRLFPSVATITHEQDVAGKVFGYRVDQPGVVSGGYASHVHMRVWDECTACPDFDACYRLSAGKLLMEFATRA